MKRIQRALRLGACIVAAAAFCFAVSAAGKAAQEEAAQEETKIIYVAGNPGLYPIEYYDRREKKFRGLLPELLGKFADTKHYRIVYLDSGNQDRRAEKNKNRQAELISACVRSDGFPPEQWDGGLSVLQTERESESVEYRILFTELADEGLKQELRSFFSTVTDQEWKGLLLAAAERKETNDLTFCLFAAGGVASLIMAIFVLVAIKNRKRLRMAQLRLGTDEVTEIGNREYLERYYRQFVTDKNRVLYSMVYFHTDTDRLHRLSGGAETNEFLRYAAVILNEYTSDTDILARVSDGGFALLRLAPAQFGVREWIYPVIRRIREYSEKYDKPFSTDIHAGIYRLKAGDRDLDAIISYAEQTCYFARDNDMDYAECTKEIITAYEEESSLQERTGLALKNEEFVLYLHFFVDASTQKIVGAEALSRWNHPEKGLLTPGRYIPLMERENTVLQLDYYMLERVCAFLESLNRRRDTDFFISCNFSRNTFVTPSFVEECKKIIEKYRFPKEELILELTESGSVSDMDIIYQNAVQMKEYGVSIALDDFGSGCAAFSDLAKYRFDGLKLDASLTASLASGAGEAILSGVIKIGHELGMTVLAEGVETEEQFDKLKALGCDVIQGYYFYKPVPLMEARRIYEERQAENGIE